MNEDKEPYLRIGDFIILCGKSQAFKNTEMHGVLSGLGFTEKQIFFQTLPFDLTNPKLAEEPQQMALIRNYRDFVFQIWPRLNSEGHKELRRVTKDKPKFEKLKDSNHPDDQKAVADYNITLLKHRERAEAERKANHALIESQIGMTVQYGSEIQLMHADSKLFITGKLDTSESDMSAYRFELSDKYDSKMVFKILPKYKVYNDGSPVQVEDEVHLYNVKLDCYVNFAPGSPIDIDLPLKSTEKLPRSPYQSLELRKPDPNSLRYLAHLSQYQDTTWRLRLHRRCPQRRGISINKLCSKMISGGDLIRLRQPESHGCIAADVSYQGQHNEVYLREYFGPENEEKNSANEIWEVEKIRVKERGACIKSRGQDFHSEDDLTEQVEIKLRHFLTGRLMSLVEVNLNDRKKFIPILAPLDDEKAALSSSNSVFFVPTVFQNHQGVQDGSSYGIGFHGESLFLTTADDITYSVTGGIKVNKTLDNILTSRDSISDLERIKQTSIPDFFTPQKDRDTWLKRKVIYLDEQKSAQYTFYVEKLSEKEKREMLYIASTAHRLQHFLSCIKTKQIDVFTPEYIKKLIHSLAQLIIFLMETNKHESINALTYEGHPIVSRQKLIRDMYFIEILTDMLFYPFHLKLYQLDDLSDELMVQIFQHCHKLIRMAIHEFRTNEVYASQWLELFIYQTLSTNQNTNILAGPTLTELIDNNRKILETRINIDTIKKFVESLKSPVPNKKFVNLVRALVVCDGEPLTANQEIISNLITSNQTIFDCLCYRIEQQPDGGIYVKVPPYNAWVKLKDLSAYVLEQDFNYEVYDYFISAIELLADLCLSRNFIAINKIQQIYTREICCSIISSAAYDTGMRKAFARLLNSVWIDRDFEVIDLPNYLFTWDEITMNNCEDLFSYNQVPYTFESYKTSIQNYLESIAARGFLRAYDRETNALTREILENLKTLLRLGYYSSLKELEEILPCLLDILNGFKDVTNQVEESHKHSVSFSISMMLEPKKPLNIELTEARYKKTPDTLVLMQIKIKILQIIEFVLNYINDFRVRRILMEFKKGSEPQRKKSIHFLSKTASTLDLAESIDEVVSDPKLRMNTYSKTNFNTVLIDLVLYQNSQLQHLAFQTIYKVHTMRLSIKELLQGLHLVYDRTAIKNVETIKSLGVKIRHLADTMENWYGINSEYGYELSEQACSTITKLTELLVVSEHFVKSNEPEEEMLITDMNFPEDQLRNLQPDAENQRIIRYLKTYTHIISIFTYDLKSRLNPQETRPPAAKRVLKAGVKFLTRFVIGDKANQRLVAESMSILMRHLKRDSHLGLEAVISELFYDNKILLEETSSIESYINVVLRLIEELPNQDLKRGKMLLTFNSLMKYCGTIVKRNQTLILTSLLRKEYHTLFYDFSKPGAMGLIKKELAKFHHELTQQQTPIVLPGELDYLCSLLGVLSVATDGKNTITESKSQALFPIKVIKELWEIAQRCYHVKLALIEFFYHSYVDTEREIVEKDSYLNDFINLVVHDFDTIVSGGWEYDEIQTHHGLSITKNTQIRIIMDGILPVMRKLLVKKVVHQLPDFTSAVARIHKNFQVIVRENKNLPEQVEVQKLLDQIRRQFKNKINFEQDDLFLLGNGLISSAIWADHRIESPFATKMSFPRVDSSTPRMELESNVKLIKLANALHFLDSEEFQKEMEQEFEHLLRKVVNIEGEEDRYIKITLEQVIKGFIDLIGRNENPLESGLRATGLKILRKIIEREAQTQKPAAEWAPSDWSDYLKEVVNKQNQLANFGVVELACKLLSSTKSSRVTKECINLMIALLVGGNKKAQAEFLKYMQNDYQNELLEKIKTSILKELENIKSSMQNYNEELEKTQFEQEEEVLVPIKGGSKRRRTKKSQVLPGPNLEDSDQSKEIQSSNNLTGGTKHSDELAKETRDSVATLVKYFRILQLLCEGHNLDIQNHLRMQVNANGTFNYKSFNFLVGAAAWFGGLIRYINIHCISFGNQLLDFLIEAVQGPCAENQQTLVNTKIIDFCIEFSVRFSKNFEQWRRGFRKNTKELDDLIKKTFKLLFSLIEGSHDPKIIKELSMQVNLKFFIERLATELRYLCKRLGLLPTAGLESINERIRHQGNGFDEEIQESFNIFILLQTLADHNEKLKEDIEQGLNGGEFTHEQRKAFFFFKMNVKSIEIMFHNDLIRVYFPVPPISEFLTEETKENFMRSVPRDSHNEKILALIVAKDDLVDEMEHLAYLSRWKIQVTSHRYTLLRQISIVVAFVINLIILFTYVREFDDTGVFRNNYLVTKYHEYFGGDTYPALKITRIVEGFGILQIIITTLVFVLFMILQGPIMIRRYWRAKVLETKLALIQDDIDKGDDKKQSDVQDKDEIDLTTLTSTQTVQLLYKHGPDHSIFKRHGQRDFGNTFTAFFYYSTNFSVILGDSRTQFSLFYVLLAYYGSFYDEIAYCLMLLDIVNRSSDLQTIVESIKVNLVSFLSTALLWIILIYIFTLFGIWFLDDVYWISELGEFGERACSSMLECFVITIDFGTRIDAGIGEYLQVPSYDPHTRVRWYVKIIWEFFYFVVINYMITEAIFGIIVEGFAVLRERKEHMEEDMFNVCFICDLERSFLDKYGKGFDIHCEEDHNPWNYFYFMYFLKMKDHTEYNGIESYIDSKLETDDTSWIPYDKTLDLKAGAVPHAKKKKKHGHGHGHEHDEE